MSALVFLSAVLAHILLHRLLRRPIAAVAAYPMGFLFLVAASRGSLYPLTTAALYALLVAGHLLFFFSYLNEAESPSAKVLEIVRDRGPLTAEAIVSRFTNEELIGARIGRLVRAGWVAKRGRLFVPTKRGALLAGLVQWYRRLLRWDEGG